MLSLLSVAPVPFPLSPGPLAATQTRVTGLLAHQGGWDEILLVLGPIAVIAGLILIARRRIGSGPDNGANRP
jgi:hypothetical protein